MRRLFVAVIVAACVAVPAVHAGAGKQPDGVRIVNLNLLHGLFCPGDTEGCQATDRVELLMRQLEEAGCPEIVGLQEINGRLSKILTRAVPKACDGEYEQVFTGKLRGSDTERVLTTLPVKSKKVELLVGNFRTASRAVLQSPLGPIVLVVTHQDGDSEKGPLPPCQNCPPPCKEAQVDIYGCQTVAATALAEDAGGKDAIRVLMGDFNVTVASSRYQRLLDEGWVDTHLAAGNAECDASSAANCTAGRDDQSLPSLQDPTKRQVERIDFIFVKAPASCDLAVDAFDDTDGDGVGTGLWNGEPTPDGPGGIVWTSDHTGTSADISCS
jgi:Endonuclease/Exonuclease/phosphatase family